MQGGGELNGQEEKAPHKGADNQDSEATREAYASFILPLFASFSHLPFKLFFSLFPALMLFDSLVMEEQPI